MPIAVARLIDFIAEHGFRAVELPSGKILAEELYADSGDGWVDYAHEAYGPYWTVLEPTLKGVRDWLGY